MKDENNKLLIKSKNKIKRFFLTPDQWLGWLFIVVFGYLVMVPAGRILLATFQVHSRDTRRIGEEVGSWTLFYWDRLFNSEFSRIILYEPFLNTVFIALVYSALAMSIGIIMAYLIIKTDMMFKNAIRNLSIIPYVMPSWSIAMAWITLFGSSEIGVGTSGIFQELLGIPPPGWLAYGPLPIIICLAINYYSYTFLLTSAALSSVDGTLEESAIIKGASDFRTLRSIVLPLILPALGSAFILTFAKGMGTFGVPAFLGIPVRFDVLATNLYNSASVGRFGDAFAITVVLVLTSATAIFFNNKLVGKRKQFTTMTGKGTSSRTVKLGRWRKPISFFTLFFVIMSGIFPIMLLIWNSISWRVGNFSLSNLTLQYWIGRVDVMNGILVESRVQGAIVNTIILGVSVALITAFIGIIAGYVVSKNRGTKFGQFIEQLSFLPYVIPGIAFGAIFLTMFSTPTGPIPSLYGTMSLLILAAVVKRLPFASRTGISAMLQVGKSLEEAGEIQGAGLITRFRRIILPLSKKGFVAGMMLSFISSVKDLSLVILLVSPRTIVLTALTFGYFEIGHRQFADAIVLVIIFITLTATFLMRKLTKADPLTSFGEGG